MCVHMQPEHFLIAHAQQYSQVSFRNCSLRPMQSPNYEHLKFAAQWIDAYPEATSYACPGLIELHPEIPYTATVGVENTTPLSWPSEVSTHACYSSV